MRAVSTRVRALVRVGGAAREQLRRDGARRLALAAPRRAVQQVRVRRLPVRGGAEHGGGVRVGLERGERHGVTSPKASATRSVSPGRRNGYTSADVDRGRLITVEGLDGAGKTTLVGALAGALHEPDRRRSCCASPAASSCPSASARSSRIPPSRCTRARRRCSTRRPARSSSPSSSSRCSPPAAGCCSTASSTPRSPTRAPGAASASRRSARSTCSRPAA